MKCIHTYAIPHICIRMAKKMNSSDHHVEDNTLLISIGDPFSSHVEVAYVLVDLLDISMYRRASYMYV
jgi:hypothetical protein